MTLRFSWGYMKILNFVLKQVQWKFTKSSGPGGQNVNKSNSKAEIRVPLSEFPDQVRSKIEETEKNRVSKLKELYISSDLYRSRLENQKHVVEKLTSILEDASRTPQEPCEEKKAKINKL